MFSGRQILKNTLLLTAAAALLLRFASMLFQAHLAGRIGAEGLGAVQLLLSVFAFATTLGLAGMRVAASCLCAQAHGKREPEQVQLAAAHCLGSVLVTSTLAAAGLYVVLRRFWRNAFCMSRRQPEVCACSRDCSQPAVQVWCWAGI